MDVIDSVRDTRFRGLTWEFAEVFEFFCRGIFGRGAIWIFLLVGDVGVVGQFGVND